MHIQCSNTSQSFSVRFLRAGLCANLKSSSMPIYANYVFMEITAGTCLVPVKGIYFRQLCTSSSLGKGCDGLMSVYFWSYKCIST